MNDVPEPDLRSRAVSALQSLSLTALAGLSGLAIGFTLLALFGYFPWIDLPLSLGGTPLPHAGAVVQIVLTLFLLALMAFLPASQRVMRLETSHRDFKLGVEDIARAYRACHEADRAGLFTLESEFDAVRERFAFLRGHPDFAAMEAEILEIAAGMSAEARDLAEVFSDETMAQARDFIVQRQAEADRTQRTLAAARATCREIRHWLDQVEGDERRVRTELRALESELLDLLPRLGFDTEIEDRPRKVAPAEGGTVVPMNRPGHPR